MNKTDLLPNIDGLWQASAGSSTQLLAAGAHACCQRLVCAGYLSKLVGSACCICQVGWA